LVEGELAQHLESNHHIDQYCAPGVLALNELMGNRK
jgi:hypothetical protein